MKNLTTEQMTEALQTAARRLADAEAEVEAARRGRDMLIIAARPMRGFTLEYIGELLGMSRQAVKQAADKAGEPAVE